MSNVYYRGNDIFLYVVFKDSLGNLATSVTDPVVSIVRESNGEIVYDLDKVALNQISPSEYFYNFQISQDSDYGFREVIYNGTVDTVAAQIVESFHIVPSSSSGENVIKIHGDVNQLKTGIPLVGVSIKINNIKEDRIISETFTKLEGYWEAYLYPGEYKIIFSKFGFDNQEYTVQIGNEGTELKFDNVALELVNDTRKGRGAYLVTDRFVNRLGVPLNGLDIKAFNIFNMNNAVAIDKTNDQGEYILYLDPGVYFVKIDGKALDEEYNYVFRLRVNDDGTNQLENLSGNVAIATDDQAIGRGNGSQSVVDSIVDKNGNPIIDVQILVFKPENMDEVIAEDYTGVTGEWNVFLDPGDYVFEYYHPLFNVIRENRTITQSN